MTIRGIASPPTAAAAGAVENTWVLPEHKIVFVSVGKNACTSVKWMLAQISGQDMQRFAAAPSAKSTVRAMVNNRSLWTGVPSFTDLDDDVLRSIGPDEGWFVFGLVRDPRTRLFSAWQSKFLVGDPLYSGRRFAGQDWLPRTPRDATEVLEDWVRFVGVMERGRGKGLPASDGHFRPQVHRLHENLVPYSRLYQVSEMDQVVTDLTAHVKRTSGVEIELDVLTENSTPLMAGREVFDGGVRERVEAIYAEDLDRFGDLWSFDKVMARPIDWSDDALRDVAARRAAGERIAHLHSIYRQTRAENERLRRELELARANARVSRPGTDEIRRFGRWAKRQLRPRR